MTITNYLIFERLRIMIINLKQNALLFYKYATKLNLPVYLKSDISAFYIQFGTKRYFFRHLQHPFNSNSSMSIVNNRHCLNNLLSSARLPVLKMCTISKDDLQSPEILKKNLSDFQFPLSIGPTLITGDTEVKDITVSNFLELKETAQLLFRDNQWLSVQDNCPYPNIYKILVFNNKIINIIHVSYPPVTENSDLNKKNRIIKLLNNSLSEENTDFLLKAARTLGVNLISLDIKCLDLEKPLATTSTIIAVDSCPDLTIYYSKSNRTILDKIIEPLLMHIIYKHPIAYLICLARSLFRFGLSRPEKLTQKIT